MKYISFFLFLASLASCTSRQDHTLGNQYISRTLSVTNGILSTTSIVNQVAEKEVSIQNSNEFMLRISKGTSEVGTDRLLTSKDFKVVAVQGYDEGHKSFELRNDTHNLNVTVYYEQVQNKPYLRKYLEITPGKDLTLEQVTIESHSFEDALQPYELKQITAQSMNLITTPTGYRPNRRGNVTDYKFGLGQPLYTTNSATFWGVEFPASTNYVEGKEMNCSYLWGREIKAGETYQTYKAVVGVADDYQYIDDAFYEYINDIKIRPLRLQVQYNSWFDYYQQVDREKFQKSVKKIYQELVTERGAKPINAYVIDDGWQDSFSEDADWSDQLWKVNTDRFDKDFASSRELVRAQEGTLGLWYSPGCFFGANRMVKKLGEQGFESLDFSMSMSGPKYMDAFEKRTLELARLGISYFKFDGIFGHLYTRAFELNGRGAPKMSQLNTAGFTSTDPRLNDSRYDELKTYYLVAGTERLVDIFSKVSSINPGVFMAITNGAYLSPWWLQYIDVVWLINAADGATGEGRSGELVYRDDIYHDIWIKENTKFPMHAIFNHEPKKVETGESKEQFSEYLFMNLSRGTGFIEFYIKTENLSEQDWDVMAEGLEWVYDVFPTFQNVKMHGGAPARSEVYGYTAWNNEQGYASFHNPSEETRKYSISLNRALGVKNMKATYSISSPLHNGKEHDGKNASAGDTISITLKPKEVKVLNFQITNPI